MAMQRLNLVDPAMARGQAKELLGQVKQAFGMVPNATKVMANSPAVLGSFLAFSGAMGSAGIGGKLHTQVKLTTSETNACSYCTSILCAIGPSAGLSADDILAGRTVNSEDGRAQAALVFAEAVMKSRGKVTDAELGAVRGAGFSDGEIVEIVASVVLGCFTNFINNVAETALDIPKAPALEPSLVG